MPEFSQIDYTKTILQFEKEERAGRRYKLGDLRTSIWLKTNNINFGDVKNISNKLPDPRLVIIGEGKLSGFYIYSHVQKKCYKNTFSKKKVLVEK
ncbi:MAG: hypothetical protein HQ541_16835 [Mariniphaga sp.]|nr:hypothetical protein [Mariniphaga sp.]